MKLEELLLQCGVKNSHLAVVHCGMELENPRTLLDELVEFFDQGILVMPAGERSWEPDAVFDPERSCSGYGAVSELFRTMKNCVRSAHPSGSLAAMGKGAEQLLAGHEKCISPYAPSSPWWRIFQYGGKIILIGCGLEECAFFAALEEWAGCAVLSRRFRRRRLALGNGHNKRMRIKLHTGKHFLKYPKAEKLLRNKGILAETVSGYGMLTVIDLREAGELLLALLKQKPRFFAGGRRSVRLKN